MWWPCSWLLNFTLLSLCVCVPTYLSFHNCTLIHVACLAPQNNKVKTTFWKEPKFKNNLFMTVLIMIFLKVYGKPRGIIDPSETQCWDMTHMTQVKCCSHWAHGSSTWGPLSLDHTYHGLKSQEARLILIPGHWDVCVRWKHTLSIPWSLVTCISGSMWWQAM